MCCNYSYGLVVEVLNIMHDNVFCLGGAEFPCDNKHAVTKASSAMLDMG